MSGSIKASAWEKGKKKKKKRRQGGRRPGEPCRCDKLKISAAAHGDAPHGLCSRRAFVSLPAAAAVATRGTFLTRPPALPERSSQCPRHDTRGRLSPRRPQASLAVPRRPSPALPATTRSLAVHDSQPPLRLKILQLLGALAQTRLPHGSETKASGNRQPSCRFTLRPSPGGQLGDTGGEQVRFVFQAEMKGREGTGSPMSCKIRGGFVLFNARPFWPA